jgi:4-alpha-glucanotransferase
VLPLGPTGFGHSPYQALSSFAANPLVLSPDQLKADDLLQGKDLECSFPADHVDFEQVIAFKERLLAHRITILVHVTLILFVLERTSKELATVLRGQHDYHE